MTFGDQVFIFRANDMIGAHHFIYGERVEAVAFAKEATTLLQIDQSALNQLSVEHESIRSAVQEAKLKWPLSTNPDGTVSSVPNLLQESLMLQDYHSVDLPQPMSADAKPSTAFAGKVRSHTMRTSTGTHHRDLHIFPPLHLLSSGDPTSQAA